MIENQINNIAVDYIYYYLNNPSKYTKLYIQKNFESAIILLSKNLEAYCSQNPNIKQYKLGEKQITFSDGGLKRLFEDVKGLLPPPCKNKGVIMV